MSVMGSSDGDVGKVPSHWGEATLEQIVLMIRQGKACGRYSRSPPGVLHLRPMNISRDGRLDLSDCRFIDETHARDFPRAQRGDVLFNNTNSRKLVGKTISIDVDEDLTFSNHMTLLRFPKILSYRFMAHQLHFLWMTGAFKPLLKQYVNQASVSMKVLRGMRVALPPPREQHEIADRVDLLLGHVRKASVLLASSQEKVERYTRAVLRVATNGLLLPGASAWTYDAEDFTLTKGEPEFAELPLVVDRSSGKRRSAAVAGPSVGRVPHGWSVVRIDEVGETRLGLQRHPERQIGENLRPYLRVANVLDNKIDFADLKYMNFRAKEYKRYRLRPGDILLNEGQSLSLVGRPAMFRGEMDDICFQNTLIRFRAYESVDAEFALIVFRHYFYNGQFSKIARWSTNIAHLGLRRFSALPFPLPPIDEQREISAATGQWLNRVAPHVAAIPKLFDRLESLRFAILRQALSGGMAERDSTAGNAEQLVEQICAEVLREKDRDPHKSRRKKRHQSQMRKRRTKELELNLIRILAEAGGKLPTEELLERSTYDENSIDDFYSNLAVEVRNGSIREGSRIEARSRDSSDTQSVVELVK